MRTQMLLQITIRGERPLTTGTFVRFITRMNPHMFLQVTLLGARVTALRAPMRLLPGVSPYVVLQPVTVRHHLPAVWTHKFIVLRVVRYVGPRFVFSFVYE